LRDTFFIRDAIIKLLKKKKEFNTMAAAEINGFNFSAADIALSDGQEGYETYRIVVISYKRKKEIV